MKKLFFSSLCLSLSLNLLSPNSSWAHSPSEDHKPWCCSEHREIKDDPDHTRAFIEGTPNLISPSTFEADTAYFIYSHQYLLNRFPRGSNPGFNLYYSPINNLQLGTIASIRADGTNEFEFGARYQLLNEYKGDWLSLAPRIAYSTRGNLVGGELSASKFIFKDRWQVGLNYSFLSNGATDNINRMVNAVGVNTILRVWKHWHLFGDAVIPIDNELLTKRSLIWTAGIKKRIPWTPHILTIFVGSNQQQTLSSRVISGNVLGGPGASWTDFLTAGFTFSIGIPESSKTAQRLF